MEVPASAGLVGDYPLGDSYEHVPISLTWLNQPTAVDLLALRSPAFKKVDSGRSLRL